jgi:hypothetical protein
VARLRGLPTAACGVWCSGGLEPAAEEDAEWNTLEDDGGAEVNNLPAFFTLEEDDAVPVPAPPPAIRQPPQPVAKPQSAAAAFEDDGALPHHRACVHDGAWRSRQTVSDVGALLSLLLLLRGLQNGPAAATSSRACSSTF